MSDDRRREREIELLTNAGLSNEEIANVTDHDAWMLAQEPETITPAMTEAVSVDGVAITDDRLLHELGLLYNHSADDSRQFTRWQMLVAIKHGISIGAHLGESKE